MIARGLAVWLVWASGALAQGFAELGTDAKGFALPDPGHVFSFPEDHGAHPAFRIEWWYVTATLEGADGTPYGIQWTLFRSALAPEERAGWESPQIWLGHAGMTTPDRHFVAERLSRGGVGTAGVRAAPFEAWIDTWEMTGLDEGLSALRLRAEGAEFGYELALDAEGPLVFHGVDGYSVKSPEGQASHYYSQPFYRVEGKLMLPEGPVAVTGIGWLDREWSSQPLAADQSGWDWFSLSFETGEKLMAFRLRDDGQGFRSGTWIAPDGETAILGDGDIVVTPEDVTDIDWRTVPTGWRLEIPGRDLSVEVAAVNPMSWMATSIPYWEGPVVVTGSHHGRGYLEMTGY